ncbi:hypothetical protein C2E23DRAFT_890774 [Lenzites betulinus]|nr:hypothetical protein C2E23DRAFT_890774 [Lenzites betulinus]
MSTTPAVTHLSAQSSSGGHAKRSDRAYSHSASSSSEDPGTYSSEDSDSDSPSTSRYPRSKDKGKARATNPTKPRPALRDSSDDERTTAPGARKRKRKHARVSHGPSGHRDDEAPRARARRFDWSHGPGKAARAYLETRFEEWAHCGEKDLRETITKEAEEYVVTHYDFPQHTSGDVRKCVRTWFRNAQRRAQREARVDRPSLQSADHPADLPPRIALNLANEFKKAMKGRATSAAAHWARSHESLVRERMQGSKIGDRQHAVKACFDALPEEEQRLWRIRAKEEVNRADAKPNRCFDNQRMLPQLLGKVLDQFPGYGPENFGSLVMYVRIGMRDQEGVILREEITVGAPIEADCRSFASFEGGAHIVEQERWERFLHKVLPSNPLRGDPRLIVTPEGIASLPEVDNSWTRDDFVALMDSYFRLVWTHSRGHDEPLSWPDVTANPASYLAAPWDSICARNPCTANYIDLVVLYSRLLEAQKAGTPFMFRECDDLARAGSDATNSHSVPHTPSAGARIQKVFPTPVHHSVASTPRRTHTTPLRPEHGDDLRRKDMATLFGTKNLAQDDVVGAEGVVSIARAAEGVVSIARAESRSPVHGASVCNTSSSAQSHTPPDSSARSGDHVAVEASGPVAEGRVLTGTRGGLGEGQSKEARGYEDSHHARSSAPRGEESITGFAHGKRKHTDQADSAREEPEGTISTPTADASTAIWTAFDGTPKSPSGPEGESLGGELEHSDGALSVREERPTKQRRRTKDKETTPASDQEVRKSRRIANVK